ncbi:MAG: hypothetical protein FWH33_06245 [Oscillospiraceae bacterium]|nr:hypothetical protein [Oscillospiraceae bacterium]
MSAMLLEGVAVLIKKVVNNVLVVLGLILLGIIIGVAALIIIGLPV